MALTQMQNIIKSTCEVYRLRFSTSSSFNNKWRLKQGLERNPNQYGPIKLLPDYSFVDGRPVPLSFTNLKQMKYQEQLCQRIVELSNEMDVGLQQYYEKQEQKKKEKMAIIQNKLKPKGSALLKEKKATSKS